MGAIRKEEVDVTLRRDGVCEVRQLESGPMTVEFGQAAKAFDPTPLFKGLPDDMCQCHHYGYVIRGILAFRTKDAVTEIQAGEAFHIPPGHIPLPQEGSSWIQFTQTADLRMTNEAVARNAT